MLNAITKMLGIITNSKPKMIVDLSNASDDGLALVLMRVSGVDLLKSCTQVCKNQRKDGLKSKLKSSGFQAMEPHFVAEKLLD